MKIRLFTLIIVAGLGASFSARSDIGVANPVSVNPPAAVTECGRLQASGYTVTNLTRGSTTFAVMNSGTGCGHGKRKILTTGSGGVGPIYYCATCKGRLCSRPNTTDGADAGFGCAVPPSGKYTTGSGATTLGGGK